MESLTWQLNSHNCSENYTKPQLIIPTFCGISNLQIELRIEYVGSTRRMLPDGILSMSGEALVLVLRPSSSGEEVLCWWSQYMW